MKNILLTISIVGGIIFASIGLSEYYQVSIKNDIENYPFGGEGPAPYFYKSAELYSNVCLFYGVIFSVIVVLATLNWKTKKVSDWMFIGLNSLAIIMWLIQSNV